MKITGLCVVHRIAMVLLIIGGLNWGLVGLFNLDLVALILGSIPLLATLVYVLVGVSAVLVLILGSCKKCKNGCADCDRGPKAPAQV